MSIQAAIAQLTADMDALGQPREGEPSWWRLRALAHGHALLSVMEQLKLTDPKAAEMFRKFELALLKKGITE